MNYRLLRTTMALCLVTQAALAGCTTKGSGTPVTPFPPTQTHLYVFNADPSGGSIASFPIGAAGNSAPSTSISGSLTGLNAPIFGTLSASGVAYAPNVNANSVTTYAAGSTGNVGPTSDLAGPYTGLGQPSGVGVASSGNYYVCNSQGGSPYTSVTEYAAGSGGNAAPLATIRGAATTLSSPADVALDASSYVYVSNNNASSGGGWIAVFSPNSNGNIAPARIIQGAATGLNEPLGIALDASGNLYVSNHAGNSVTIFAAGANGNVAPLRVITGSKTGLSGPTGVTVDSNGYVYVANNSTPSITVYAAGATGNVVPIRTIAGSNTGLNRPYGLALY
jgi:6-phosphogluconolactonase (cycloisomerase 2 family)